MDLPRTRAALAHYDATYEERAITHNADMTAWAAAEKAVLDDVRRALFEETSDRNRLGTVMAVPLPILREIVASGVTS